jgi:hypothetical protein
VKAEELVALLGRPLTAVESANRKLYLEIAQERLEDLTCMNLSKETEDRVFDVRNGYSTVFTDLFTTINSVSVNGTELATDKYTIRQWDRRNASWYNSIILEDCQSYKEVTINADWGVCSPELKLLLANLFALVGKMSKGNGNVKSKKVEDFSITYNENTVYQQFLIDNEAVLTKYSICGIGQVQSGKVGRGYCI